MMTPYDTGETKDASEINDASPDRSVTEKPSRQEAEAAVDVLLRWIGENPAREGLAGTPGRVVRAWSEFCSGYDEDPAQMLARTFEEVEGYDDMVMLRNIRAGKPLRTSFGANFGCCPYCLYARPARCWHFQIGAGS